MRIDIFFKKVGKFLLLTAIALFISYLGAESGYQVKHRLELWKTAQNFELFNKSLIDLFKNDRDGGATPEETFNLFIDALKNEDVDLAVKYFVLDPERRINAWEDLTKLKSEGRLKEYGEWFPAWEDMIVKNTGENSVSVEFYWTQEEEEVKMLPDGAGGFIETTFPAGKYLDGIDFVKNYNKIWKIDNF